MKLATLAVVLMFTALALPAAGAAELTLDQKVDFLNQGLDTDDVIDHAVARIRDGIKQQINIASIEAIGRLNDIIAAKAKSLKSSMEIAREVDESVYTAEEIDILYKFFSSPDGRKILAKNAALTNASEVAVRTELQTFYDDVLKELQSDPELSKFVGHMPPHM